MPNRATRFLIVYPYSSIDTNPTMAFLLESLAARRIEVDVLTGKTESFTTPPESFLVPESFGETVRLQFLPFDFFFRWWSPVKGLPLRLANRLVTPGSRSKYPLRLDHAFFKYFYGARYSAIIGVDPHGIVLADALNRWARRPLIYISFEILFGEDVDSAADRELMQRERDACRRTSLVLIQDDERAQAFSRETGFPPDRIFNIPVAPPPQPVERSDFLRRTLQIPPGKRIVLLCGNLQSWSSRDELREMVSYWPDDYCLVIHNRSNVQRTLQRFLEELSRTGRVITSAVPVGRTDMATLVGSADFGLAPYKPVPGDLWSGKNLYHLGFASGKVSYYAMCGLPMLVRPLPVFEREFSRYNCGKIYHRLADTADLLQEMWRDYETFSSGAKRFYQERLNPQAPMEEFCGRLLQLAREGH